MKNAHNYLLFIFISLAYLPYCYSETAPKLISSLVKLDLGNVQIDQALSQEFKVDVPDGYQSLTLQVEGLPNYYYEFAMIKEPTGDLILGKARMNVDSAMATKYPILQNLLSPNPMTQIPFEGFAAAMIPNSPLVKLKTGEYTFKILSTPEASVFAAHKIHLIAYLKKIGGNISNDVYGRIDINLNFSGVGGLTLATYKTDKNFQAFIDKLQERLSTAHLIARIKNVQDFKMTPYDSLENSATAISKDVAAGQNSSALNIFFTQLERDPSTEGASFGVPGPFGSNKGVMLFIFSGVHSIWESRSPQYVALYAAHEIGHYLGLFHDCDMYGGEVYGGGVLIPNPIPDTTCEPNVNIMESGVREPDLGFSEQQKQVMFNHPLVELFEIKNN